MLATYIWRGNNRLNTLEKNLESHIGCILHGRGSADATETVNPKKDIRLDRSQ
jgi:hypothetical protein